MEWCKRYLCQTANFNSWLSVRATFWGEAHVKDKVNRIEESVQYTYIREEQRSSRSKLERYLKHTLKLCEFAPLLLNRLVFISNICLIICSNQRMSPWIRISIELCLLAGYMFFEVLTYGTSRGVSGGRAGGVGGRGPASHLTTNRENVLVH